MAAAPSPGLTRRQVLGAAGAGAVLALAGCLGSSRAGPTDRSLAVEVRNETPVSQRYDLTVLDPAGDPAVTLPEQTVAAGVNARHDPEIPPAAGYETRLPRRNWATAGHWNPEACPEKRFVTSLTGTGETPVVAVETDCDRDA